MTFNPKRGRDAVDPKVKGLLIGKPKTFKTGFAASWPKPWFADFDLGIETAIGVNPDVLYSQYRDKSPMKPQAFRQFQNDLEDAAKSDLVETIVVDTLTFMYDSAMLEAQKLGGRTGQPIPVQKDWLMQMNLCYQVLQYLTSLDKHVLCLAHIQTDKDELTGRIETGAQVTGKHTHKIPALFDFYFCMEMVSKQKGEPPKPMVRTIPDAGMALGGRFLGLEDFEEPKFDIIYPKILAARTGGKESVGKAG